MLQAVVDFVYTDMLVLTEQNRERDDMAINGMTTIIFSDEKWLIVLQVVVDFVYTGMLALTVENVEEVLSAATHLQVSVAVELCSKYLEMAITVDNCVDILNLSELYSLGSMSSRARQFILENFEVQEQFCGFVRSISHSLCLGNLFVLFSCKHLHDMHFGESGGTCMDMLILWSVID